MEATISKQRGLEVNNQGQSSGKRHREGNCEEITDRINKGLEG